MLPLEWLPRPRPLRVETKGDWELAHAPYEERWISRLTLQPPYGYSKMRSSQSMVRARPSQQPDYQRWFEESKNDDDDVKPLAGLPQHSALGLAYVVPILRRWKKSIIEGKIDPAVHFRSYSRGLPSNKTSKPKINSVIFPEY